MAKDYIKKFIWVFPDWLDADDMSNNTLQGEQFTISIGYYSDTIDGESVRGLCACYVSVYYLYMYIYIICIAMCKAIE